jgi:hypothetical protein
MNIADLAKQFVAAGCKKLYAKALAENDNSKNQVYFGPGFHALNLFPNDGVYADSSPRNAIFKARLNFGWLLENGEVAKAPNAQLILYPQYPEVRFSGFLKACEQPPSHLMRERLQGRVLFLGVTEAKTVIGFVVDGGSPVALEFQQSYGLPDEGVFHEITLPGAASEFESKVLLLGELKRVYELGWIDSKQLGSNGSLTACNAPQCGGFTLEAELGISKNSKAEPDFHGWEVKQHSVTDFKRVAVGTITLMTPEPTGGFYREQGVEEFVRHFGYADMRGREDRLNFGGIHKVGFRHPRTLLTMALDGYDSESGKITNADGSIALVSDSGQIAASWAFAGLLEHWSRKHSKAVYVPSKCRKEPARQYHYGNKVRLAQGTDALHLLHALALGDVYYDPGIKLENASTPHPHTKRRSQFRVGSKNICSLYDEVEEVLV